MWYVTQTTAGKEFDAIRKCRKALDEKMASHIFTPVSETMIKIKGEWRLTQNPIFPGYVFIETTAEQKTLEKLFWRIPGTVTPVRVGGGFYPIREDEEEFLRSLMDEEYHIRISTGYIVDDRLVIQNGPLDGQTEQITKINRHTRSAIMEVSLWREIRTVKVGLKVIARLTGEEYKQLQSA